MNIIGIGRLPSSLASILKEIVTLGSLSAPIIVGLLGGSAYGAIDSYMLGPVGELALACASLTSSVLIMFYSAIFGLAAPASILAGNAYGARKSDGIVLVYHNGLRVSLIGGGVAAAIMLALLPVMAHIGQPSDVIAALPGYWIAMSLSLIPYSSAMVIKLLLDAIGRPWIAAALAIIPVGIVIPLNWLLIYGHWGFPALGLLGAGVATLIAQTIGFFILRYYFVMANGITDRTFGAIDRAGVSKFARLSFPMSLQYLAESSAIGVIGLLVGLFGSEALAANQIALSLGELVYMAPLGIAGAVGILIAQALGENAHQRIRSIGIASFALVTLITLPFCAAMITSGEQVARIFVSDDTITPLAGVLLGTVGIVLILDGLQCVALGALRGLLDNRWPTSAALISYWLVAIPMSILLGFVFDFGPVGIWSGFGCGVVLAAVLLAHRFLRKAKPSYAFATGR